MAVSRSRTWWHFTVLIPCLLLAGLAAALELSSRLLEYVEENFGSSARDRLEAWEQLVAEKSDLPEPAQLEVVNDFFNQIPFKSDLEHWGQPDYWATPVEFLATNGGDCEDYSIAKYTTLRALGVPDEKMRITYVHAKELNQAHMVLTYYPEPGADPLVLDNLIDEIQPASMREDLRPVYSFNGENLWLSQRDGGDRRVGDADAVEQWVDLRDRMINVMR